MRLYLTYFLFAVFFTFAHGQIGTIKGKPAKNGKSDEQLAAQYMQNKEYEKAATLYEKLYEERNSHFYYTYYLYCLIELQEFNEAEKLVKKAYRKSHKSPRYMVDLGYVYSQEGNVKKAEKVFEEAIEELHPQRNQVVELANAFLLRNQTTYAIKTYLHANRMLNENAFGFELANVYFHAGKYQQMVEEYLNLLVMNENFLNRIQSRLQSAMDNDPDDDIGEILKEELLRRVQRQPDKVIFSEMLLWQSIQEKDFEMALIQAKSLDRRFNENGIRIYKLAELMTSNEFYDEAIESYRYIMKKGKKNAFYLRSLIGLLNVRYLKITNTLDFDHSDLVDLEEEYIKTLDEYGRNPATVPIMRYLGHLQAFYLDKPEEAIKVLNEALEIPGLKEEMIAECKLELAGILLFSGDEWEASLLYSQVEKAFKNEPIGHLAKFKNAELFYYIGEFGWAKVQLDILKAASSKLIANDAMDLSLLISDNISLDSTTTILAKYARADLLSFRNKDELAIKTLDSILGEVTWHPIIDEVIFKKAGIRLKQGKYESADSLLSTLVENYSYDILADDALYKRAEINLRNFNDSEKAMSLYHDLLLGFPGSLYTVEARKRYRELRGDEIN